MVYYCANGSRITMKNSISLFIVKYKIVLKIKKGKKTFTETRGVI